MRVKMVRECRTQAFNLERERERERERGDRIAIVRCTVNQTEENLPSGIFVEVETVLPI